MNPSREIHQLHHKYSFNSADPKMKSLVLRPSKSVKPTQSNFNTKQTGDFGMDELTKFKERILLETGCQSIKELLEMSSNIDEENEKLLGHIGSINDKIENYEK